MRKISNLTQLLSRMKTIYGRKTQHEENPAEPTTQETQNSDLRLRNALTEVEKYLADNFGTAYLAMTYEEYNNGISLTSDDTTFSTSVVILTHTNGMLNPPDNVILLGNVKSDKDDDYLIEHIGNFIKYLMKLGVAHQIQHLAIAFSKEQYDHPNAVKTAAVTCIRLY